MSGAEILMMFMWGGFVYGRELKGRNGAGNAGEQWLNNGLVIGNRG